MQAIVSPVRRWRIAARWACLLAAVVLTWPGRPEAWDWTSVVLPSLSPLVALGGALGARAVTIFTLLAVPVLLLAWWVPRVICAYGCPVGLLQEMVARLNPGSRRRWRRLPPIGAWLAVATAGGAVFGYPLFLFLDPFAIFASGLNAWRLPLTGVGLIAGLGLPALLLLEIAFPQLWCRRLCPLGATQDLLKRSRRWLGGAGQPSREAPLREAQTRTILTADGADTADKSSGGSGYLRNRRNPRSILPGQDLSRPQAQKSSSGRRTFLAACAGGAGALAAKSGRSQPPPLRPPGSLDDENFTGVCVRCGNCARVCPPRIIQPDLAGGLTALLTPRLSFAEGYCREDCHRCQQVCPSGAIRRQSLPEKRRAVIGSARVDLETCLMALGRECNACVQSCPFEAIAVVSAGDAFSSRPLVDLDRCNGCGACEAACPVRPGRAVRVRANQTARFSIE